MEQRYTTKQKHTFIIGMFSLVLLLCIGPYIIAPLVNIWAGRPVSRMTIAILSRFFYWGCVAAVILYVVKVEKQPVLLQTERKLSVGVFILSMFLLFVSTISIGMIINLIAALTGNLTISPRLLEMLKLFRENTFLLILTPVTAGITEELIFRGYLQPRFQILFNSAPKAIFATSLLFGLTHYGYGTLSNILGPFAIGLLYGVYYSKFQNIFVLIASHMLWDFVVICISLYRLH